MGASWVGPGLLFMAASVFFVGAAAYLWLQTIDRSLDWWTVLIVYAPLGLCWVGIGATIRDTKSWLPGMFAVLAVAWCLLVVLKHRADGGHVEWALREERIQRYYAWLDRVPQDMQSRFRLAEALEDSGQLRAAYEQYAACLAVDPKNPLALLRARELYEKIIHKPMPAPGDVPPPPDSSAAGLSRAPVADPMATVAAGAKGPDQRTSMLSRPVDDSPAVQQAKRAVADNPKSAALCASLAEAYLQDGRTADAIAAYRRAVWLDPSNDRYRANLATLEA
jgi:tetratricopeptide (TPR) repeat protein